ncbi:M28 family peptidase [Gemmatimonadota bacterium]
MRYGRCLFLTISLLATLFPRTAAQLPIDTLSMRAQTYFLSHDLLAGRATGNVGAELAAEYIASECRSIGLVPAGSTFTQPVPLEETTIEAGTRLSVSRLGRQAQFSYPADFTPNVGTKASLIGFGGPAVYVGLAGELGADKLEGVNLQGAVALTAGPRITTTAVDMLRGKGVVGVVQLLPDEQTYNLYVGSRGTTRMYHEDATVESSFLLSLPSVLAGPRLSAALVAGAVQGNEIRVGPLGLEVDFNINQTRRPVVATNVACLLPGTGGSVGDTVIAFSAHYDHLGIVSPPDTAGDDIYNGFQDNAVGVAMLLGIARAMASDQREPVRHSMLFLFFVGEERGLLGSDYYVARPFWPLDRTMAVINIDAGAPPGRLVHWSLSGVDSTGLGGLALGIAQARGWQVSTSPATANSDYYPFVREGVPGVFIKPGPGSYEGISADSSDALRYRWRYYHHPQDEWTEDFPFSGLQRYAEYAYLIARELDIGYTW